HFSFCDVGLPSSHAQSFSRGVVNSQSAAEHPSEGSFFVQYAVLALEMEGRCFLVGGNFLLHPVAIGVMDAVMPFFRFVLNLAVLIAVLRLSARRELAGVRFHVPFSESVVGAATA